MQHSSGYLKERVTRKLYEAELEEEGKSLTEQMIESCSHDDFICNKKKCLGMLVSCKRKREPLSSLMKDFIAWLMLEER